MLTTIEGTYKDGKLDVPNIPPGVPNGRVLITFLGNERKKSVNGGMLVRGKYSPVEVGHERATDAASDSQVGSTRPPNAQIQFGMFKGDIDTTDEDLKIAEFHGDPDDGLDWSGC